MQRAHFVVVGEALLDVVSDGADSTPRSSPGGSPANVAHGLARQGHRVSFATHLGDDSAGHAIHAHLTDAGVELLCPLDRCRPTSTALATLDSRGAADYEFHIAWNLPRFAFPEDAIALHTGSIATMLAPGASAVEELLVRERNRGAVTISYDPNCRPALFDDVRAARAAVERMVSYADIVKASDDDVRWLYGESCVEDVAASWLSRGPALVVITRGAEGASAFSKTAAITRPAPPVAVVDTVGAGDAFAAALLDHFARTALLGGRRRALLEALPADGLAAAVDHAIEAASLACTWPGAIPGGDAALCGGDVESLK